MNNIWDKILKQYRRQWKADKLWYRTFWNTVTDEEGAWLREWYNRKSFFSLIIEIFIKLPWKLAFWWPFLILAYFWGHIIQYLFIPVLVILENHKKLLKIVSAIETFLRTFFGFFWLLENLPIKYYNMKQRNVIRIMKFSKWATQFHVHGPNWIDMYFRKKRRAIWDVYDNNIRWPWFLFKRKYVRKIYIGRYIRAIRGLILWYIKNIPFNLKYRKQLWTYRIKLIKVLLRPSWAEISVLFCNIVVFVIFSLKVTLLIIQAVLVSIEMLIVPERLSIWFRNKSKNVKRIYKNWKQTK